VTQHGPVEEAGSATGLLIDEQIAHVRITVHQRARPLTPELHNVARAREVQVGDTREIGSELRAERVDRHLDERRAAARVAGSFRRKPSEIAVAFETR
jgi:hypothetical protein